MELISQGAIAAEKIVWRHGQGGFTCTVVCKITFDLRPGVSPVAPAQDPVLLADMTALDGASLVLASDLVPFRKRPEALVKGHAHSPEGRPVTSLVARLAVGEIDKAVQVVGDRYFGLDGRLGEPARFTRMPLTWDRAAGGPDTSNPAGIAIGEGAKPDFLGRVVAPNLLPAGLLLTSRSDVVAPVCFAPIAPHWPSRAVRLHRHAAGWDPLRWNERPLPDIDLAYFNAAPPDQQRTLPFGEDALYLENLHPRFPTLSTRFEQVAPVVTLDAGTGPQPVQARCDTLVIDSDRGVATLVWRAHVPLDHPERRVRVLVAAPGPQRAQVPAWAHSVADPSSTLAPGVVSAAAPLPFSDTSSLRAVTAPDRLAQTGGQRALGTPAEGISKVPPAPTFGLPPAPSEGLSQTGAFRAPAVPPVSSEGLSQTGAFRAPAVPPASSEGLSQTGAFRAPAVPPAASEGLSQTGAFRAPAVPPAASEGLSQTGAFRAPAVPPATPPEVVAKAPTFGLPSAAAESQSQTGGFRPPGTPADRLSQTGGFRPPNAPAEGLSQTGGFRPPGIPGPAPAHTIEDAPTDSDMAPSIPMKRRPQAVTLMGLEHEMHQAAHAATPALPFAQKAEERPIPSWTPGPVPASAPPQVFAPAGDTQPEDELDANPRHTMIALPEAAPPAPTPFAPELVRAATVPTFGAAAAMPFSAPLPGSPVPPASPMAPPIAPVPPVSPMPPMASPVAPIPPMVSPVAPMPPMVSPVPPMPLSALSPDATLPPGFRAQIADPLPFGHAADPLPFGHAADPLPFGHAAEPSMVAAAPMTERAPVAPWAREAPGDSPVRSPMLGALALSSGRPLVVDETTEAADTARPAALPAIPAATPPAPEAPPEPAYDQYPPQRCGAIAGRIACGSKPVEQILRAEDLDPTSWKKVHDHWLARIREDAAKSRRQGLTDYDAAYVAAVEKERGAFALDDYARLAEAAERGDVAQPLSERNLPEAAWPHLHRVWIGRIAKDAALGKQVRTAIDLVRAAG